MQQPHECIIAAMVDWPGPAGAFAGGVVVLGEVEADETWDASACGYQGSPGDGQFSAPDAAVNGRAVADGAAFKRFPGGDGRRSFTLQPELAGGFADEMRDRAECVVDVYALNEDFAQVLSPGAAELIVDKIFGAGVGFWI